MRWLMDNKGLGMDDAKRQVMKQFGLAPPQDTYQARARAEGFQGKGGVFQGIGGVFQGIGGVLQAMGEGFQAKGEGFQAKGTQKGGFDSSNGYNKDGEQGGSGKGGYDAGKGGYDSGKGGYDAGKGGYASGRGYDKGSYDSGKGSYDSGKGSYDSGKGDKGGHGKAQDHLDYGSWNPDADCNGARAEERMRWLMDNKGLGMDDAKGQVLKEFPFVFREGYGRDWWEARADCQGLSAGDRAKWLMENEGYSEPAARTRVKTEFPKNFRGGGDHINQGKFPHCMSLVDTPQGPRLKLEVVVNAENVKLVAVHYQVNDGAPMNFEMRHPEGGSKTYAHTTPDGGGYPLCRDGDRVSYWLAAKINGLISEEPEGACPNPAARMHWTAHN